MNGLLERIKAKSKEVQVTRESITDKYRELETSLSESLGELYVYGRSENVTLERMGLDDRRYGYLCYSKGKLEVAHRTTEDDFSDAMDRVPLKYQSFKVVPLFECPSEWLIKLSCEKVVKSFLVNIEANLDDMADTSRKSSKTIVSILDSQSSKIDKDICDVLEDFGDESLFKNWIKARALITTEPAESITRSSSFIESVCRSILSGLSKSIPQKQEMTKLINECVKALGLSEDLSAEEDLKKIVGGVKSICQGVGALRTHFGTVHGKSPGDYEVNEHYARLASNSAATVAMFLLQRFKEKLNKQLNPTRQ